MAVDRQTEKETEDFLPQKRSRLYGITTTNTQCPQGTPSVTSNSNLHICTKHSFTRLLCMLTCDLQVSMNVRPVTPPQVFFFFLSHGLDSVMQTSERVWTDISVGTV